MKRSRVNPVSKKRSALIAERRVMVAKILSTRTQCEFAGCQNRSTVCHEPLTRARGGSIVDETNVMALCNRCHEYLHHHPAKAAELGYLVHSWDAPGNEAS